jgi:DNA-binding transcriptional MerR regulator
LKIGDFSRLGQVTIKALRHWDDEGLLQPARVNQWTGYRFYSAAQLRDVQRILALKALGLTLPQIKGVLREELSADGLRRLLEASEEQLRARMVADAAQLAAIGRWKKALEGQLNMTPYDIVKKTLPRQTLASIRVTVQDMEALAPLFPETEAYVREHGGGISGPGIILWHAGDCWGGEIEAEAAFPVAGTLEGNDRITIREDLPVEVASLIFKGTFEEVRPAHTAIADWIEANDYELAGPQRTGFLDCGGADGVGVVEIQYPVAAAV